MRREWRGQADGHLYVSREATDSNVGPLAHGSCPCLLLLLIYDDETVDGFRIRHMLCPSCAAGWVREEPSEHAAV